MLWRLLQCVILGLSASMLFGMPSRAKGDVTHQDDDKRYSDDERSYTLAMSWVPSLCFVESLNVEKVSESCYHPHSYWTSHLTAHGLWPDNKTGDWPSFCTNEKFDFVTVTEAVGLDRMEDMWPSVSAHDDDEQFWKHEWEKHGTCSNLSQTDYFSQTLDIVYEVGTPPSLVENTGEIVTQESIKKFYGDEFHIVLVCEDDILKEIRLCFKRGRDGKIEGRTDCRETAITTCNDTVHVYYFSPVLEW